MDAQHNQLDKKFGCSECLCIAIESHRPALLKSLLRRSDVAYRDMFWAPLPHKFEWTLLKDKRQYQYPQLHHINEHSELSYVGRANCGHMQVDTELRTPVRFDEPITKTYSYIRRKPPLKSNEVNVYILVSLPMLARWHTSKRFNAERILKQSGIFHYSEPQFFHLKFLKAQWADDLPGPLANIETCLYCQFESSCESLTLSVDSTTAPRVLHPQSTLPCEMSVVFCKLSENPSFCKYYGKLNHLFTQLNFGSNHMQHRYFPTELMKVIDSGADLNSHLIVSLFSFSPIERPNFPKTYRELDCSSPFAYFLDLCIDINSYQHDVAYRAILEMDSYVRVLLHNGLAYFYFNPLDYSKRIQYSNDEEVHYYEGESIFQLLFDCLPKGYLSPLFRGICHQLLALGYGRRELHPADFHVDDEHLDATRRALRLFPSERSYFNQNIFDGDIYQTIPSAADAELKALISSFDAGPLSLQQLSRIAIRRAVGGAMFHRHMQRIAQLLPSALHKYVAEPTEMLLPSEKLQMFRKVLVQK